MAQLAIPPNVLGPAADVTWIVLDYLVILFALAAILYLLCRIRGWIYAVVRFLMELSLFLMGSLVYIGFGSLAVLSVSLGVLYRMRGWTFAGLQFVIEVLILVIELVFAFLNLCMVYLVYYVYQIDYGY